MFHDNLVHSTADPFKNDELMNDAMALQLVVSSENPLYSCYTLSFSALKLCIDSGHNSWNSCFHVNLQQTWSTCNDVNICISYELRLHSIFGRHYRRFERSNMSSSFLMRNLLECERIFWSSRFVESECERICWSSRYVESEVSRASTNNLVE